MESEPATILKTEFIGATLAVAAQASAVPVRSGKTNLGVALFDVGGPSALSAMRAMLSITAYLLVLR